MPGKSCRIAVSGMKKAKTNLKRKIKSLKVARGQYNKKVMKVRSACGKKKKFVKQNYADNPFSQGGILGLG